MTDRAIEVTLMNREDWKRGPGGHWFRYCARYRDAPASETGYGDTEREAKLDLQKRSAGE